MAAGSREFARQLNAMVEADGSARPGVASVVASIQFSGKNRGGTTLTLTASKGCDDSTDIDHDLHDVDDVSPEWDDQISSFVGYSKCQVNFWEHPGYNGANNGWHGSDMDMGAMDDHASSGRWR